MRSQDSVRFMVTFLVNIRSGVVADAAHQILVEQLQGRGGRGIVHLLVLSLLLVEDIQMLEDHEDIVTVGILVDELESQAVDPADQVFLRGVHHGKRRNHRVKPHRLSAQITEESTY